MSLSLFARLARRYGPRTDALTRREMLRGTLAASAGLLLSRTPTFGIFDQPGKSSKRVVVVGAGFSGLACAYELRGVGYDVTVVEARNRAGGRVLSFGDLVAGKNVEGGGELIGSNHPTWVAYADKFGLKFLDVTEDESLESPIFLGGKKLTAEEGETLYKEMDEAFVLMNADAAKIDAEQPWKSPDAATLDKKTVAEWIDGLKVSDLARLGIRVQLTADNAQDVKKQSYLGMLTSVKGGGLEKYWTESEVYRCKGGNQQLADKLVEAVGKDRVNLKLPVTKIVTTQTGAVVICADGRTIEGDDVVLTAPPTVWHKIQFSPEIPATLKPQLGTAVKYLAAVKRRFWKESGLSPDSLTDGDVSMTWEGTDNQPGDEGACLNAFSGGPPAESARSRQGEPREQAYRRELDKLYPGFNDQFASARFMDWPGDPWTMAGYSFAAPGQITTVGPKLFDGLGRLHFAGEHTCYAFVGYMEGGLNSGAALAKRIALRESARKQ